MSNPLPDGIYTLRYGPDVGPGGMYATQGQFNVPIPVIAIGPSMHETWKIERVNKGDEGVCKYYILNPQHYPPGVQLTGFHNMSMEDGAPVTLGQPKEFYIEYTGKDNEYTIRPTDETKIGVIVYVGDADNTTVTKAIPTTSAPPPPPVWTILPSEG